MSSELNRQNCIFCRIADGKGANEILYEDKYVVVFEDFKPAAPTHLLAIPKIHIENCIELTFRHIKLLDKLKVGGDIALKKFSGRKISEQINGFHKPPYNSVNHLHMHVIAFNERGDVDIRRVFGPGGPNGPDSWLIKYDVIRGKLSAEKKARKLKYVRKPIDKNDSRMRVGKHLKTKTKILREPSNNSKRTSKIDRKHSITVREPLSNSKRTSIYVGFDIKHLKTKTKTVREPSTSKRTSNIDKKHRNKLLKERLKALRK